MRMVLQMVKDSHHQVGLVFLLWYQGQTERERQSASNRCRPNLRCLNNNNMLVSNASLSKATSMPFNILKYYQT